MPLRDLKRYYDTKEKNPRSRFKCITIEDVISADTDLLTLLDLFKDRKFYFVKKGRDIVGLVHYSDLKKHPVRVLFYILFSKLELEFRRLLELYYGKELDDKIEEYLRKKEKRFEEFMKRVKQDRDNNQQLPYVEYLYFSEFLNIIESEKDLLKKLKCSRKKFEKLGSLVELRNWVAHSTREELTFDKPINFVLFEKKEYILELLNRVKRAIEHLEKNYQSKAV